mgnify:CR=1 FL=1
MSLHSAHFWHGHSYSVMMSLLRVDACILIYHCILYIMVVYYCILYVTTLKPQYFQFHCMISVNMSRHTTLTWLCFIWGFEFSVQSEHINPEGSVVWAYSSVHLINIMLQRHLLIFRSRPSFLDEFLKIYITFIGLVRLFNLGSVGIWLVFLAMEVLFGLHKLHRVGSVLSYHSIRDSSHYRPHYWLGL